MDAGSEEKITRLLTEAADLALSANYNRIPYAESVFHATLLTMGVVRILSDKRRIKEFYDVSTIQ